MSAVKAHRSIFIKPIFRNVREELQGLFSKLELYTQMLQQRELGMMWSEQKRTGRMYFCAKEKRIKRMNLGIEGAIKLAHREIEISHCGGNHITFIIFLNISEVSYGSTAGSKEVSILRLTVQVLEHQCDNAPFLIIEGGEDCVDTCFHSSTAFSRASDFAIKGSYHISSSIERSDWKMQYFAHMYFPFDGHWEIFAG